MNASKINVYHPATTGPVPGSGPIESIAMAMDGIIVKRGERFYLNIDEDWEEIIPEFEGLPPQRGH